MRAFADSLAPREPVARERHVAIVMAGVSSREIVGSLLADAALRAAGTVAVRGVAELADDRPDAVVLVADCAAPAGMAALRRIRKDVPAARLVVVARDDRSAIAARQALNAGAEAFVPVDAVDRALAPALDAVMAGLVCAPRALRRLVAKPTFSHREKEVLELLVAGLTNRQIAARLYLAESTVKTHLAAAFAKLGVGSRKDAVALLLDPAEALATTALPPDALRKSDGSGAVYEPGCDA
jgi:DNA-binding NarL/FixJ family response regulator